MSGSEQGSPRTCSFEAMTTRLIQGRGKRLSFDKLHRNGIRVLSRGHEGVLSWLWSETSLAYYLSVRTDTTTTNIRW